MTPPTSPQPTDLRERLRALGYLNAPVDRFVLGGADARRSALTLAVGASARIGLLAGLLLGPAGAIGLKAQLPELITNASDAAVMAAYLAIVFGLAAALAAIAVIVPAGLIARTLVDSSSFSANARRTAAAAGTLIFLACLAYLTLWWRAAVATTSAPALLSSVAVLAVAVTISLVLGHVVMVTALAIIARVDPTEMLRPGVPLSSWNATLPLAVVAFAGATALLYMSAPGAATGPHAPPITVVPTGERVLVIGLDGIDLALFDRLRASGALPTLARLTAGATVTMPSDANRDPARVWTTIATGQPAARHGISALEGRQLAGVEGRLRPTSRLGVLVAGATDLVRLTRPSIASGSERRTPAFWEVAARAGLRTSVIQWWATWPAAEAGEDTGVVVSDRALLRLEQGGALDGEIAPASLYDALERAWPERRSRVAGRAATATAPSMPTDIATVVARSASLDATILDVASERALSAVDLQVVYLPGLDIAQYALFAANGATSPSGAATRVQAIEHYYRYLDGLLAPLTTEPRAVLLVMQPGRVATPGDGLLALSGAPARIDVARGRASTTSVAAAALYALGMPIAADLDSPLPATLFADAFTSAHPPRRVETYGARRLAPRRTNGQPLDQEMIERMRSLGYVK